MTSRRSCNRLARLGVALVAAALTAGLVALGPSAPAEAADLGQFQPGDIISDALFFDGRAMEEADVQSFLDQKGANCRTGSDGTPCLKAYRQDTQDKPGDDRCAAYAGAPGESAARIITKVGQACGISQRVLLVVLQKEQSLVTNTGATLYARRYREAMGFACPDTAPCNPAYNGFHNQVYSAARQFKNYAANPGGYGYRAGMVNQIRFHPDSACGSTPVFLYNQATAGLYNYTPYQPNEAALRAGYGSGDSCSAYGNRNFFHYFTDWFGSTHEPGAAAISAAYYRTGSTVLGAPAGAPRCGLSGGGCVQSFAHGAIYWTPATGAHPVRGAVLDAWAARRWEAGVLGYPISDEMPAARGDGRVQLFQGGAILWTPSTGAQPVRGAVRAAWGSQGAESGVLGYPTSDELSAADGIGAVQLFQGGAIFYSPSTGAHPVRGAVRAAWAGYGAETGVLGYPTGAEVPTADGVGAAQVFQGGVMLYSPATGAHPVRGAVRAEWGRAGAEDGELGYPTGPEVAGPGGQGTVQPFQRGTVHWSVPTGAHAVTGTLGDAWELRGGASGSLGLPVTSARRTAGNALEQHFQGGALFALPAAETVLVRGAVLTEYQRLQAEAGPLGLPIGEETTEPSGQVQRFRGGIIHWTPASGAVAVRGGIGGAWTASGGLTGVLGAPRSAEEDAAAGRVQHFARGSVYWSAGTGAYAVRDVLAAAYETAGGPAGLMGFPVGDEKTSGAARVQPFSSGSVYWTAGGGAHAVRGAIGTTWLAQGGLTGTLGAPVTGETAAGAGRVQRFQSGSVYWSAAAGAHVVSGPIGTAYEASGAAAGVLKLPTGPERAAGSARVQPFQGGSIYWTSAGGAHPVRGAIGTAWSASGGLTGPLGAPIGNEEAAGSGVRQAFTGGTIYWSAGTGARVVQGAVAIAYDRAGGAAGPLGLPVGDEKPSGAARVQQFTSGSIYWTSAGGAHPVRGAIGTAWSAGGGLTGPLGAPIGDEVAAGAGSAQAFQNGVLHWSATSWVHRMAPVVFEAYQAAGASSGRLGVPVSDSYVRDGVLRTDFASGAILVRNGTAEIVLS
ncbi:LGFP repeat-containing protein [Blastococcus sp. SYSU DS0539]